MKTAILLSGNIRNFQKCRDSFISQFKKFDPDIYVITYDKRYSLHPYQQLMNPVQEEMIDLEKVQEILYPLQCKKIEIVNQSELILFIEMYFKPKFDPEIKWPYPGGMDIFCQYLLFQKGLKLIPKEYSLIIKTRFDIIYTQEILHSAGDFESCSAGDFENKIGITDGGTPHVCDHLFIGRPELISEIPDAVFKCFYHKPPGAESIHSFLESSFAGDFKRNITFVNVTSSYVNRNYLK